MCSNKSYQIKVGSTVSTKTDNCMLLQIFLPARARNVLFPFFLGLGDYVPQNMHHTVFFGGFIIVGLVLVIMLFSAIEEKIEQRLDKIKQMVGLVENMQEDNKDR